MLRIKQIMEAIQASVTKKSGLVRFLVRKVITLAVVTVVFGWLYGWASPWAFSARTPSGFTYGLLHGAMMPLSLPSLLIGKNVTIYNDNNAGRIYKIGYICGVNICGLIFIGPLFWRPRTTVQVTLTNAEKSQ
jgi:hypothetical protein